MGDHAYGISMYKAFHGCIARALTEQEDGEDDGGGPDASFGTDMHAWLAAYHTGAKLPALSPAPIERSVSLADFGARYAKAVPPTALGKFALVEHRARMIIQGPGWTEPFAGTFDAISDFDQAACDQVAEVWGPVLAPGRYLIDHKTKTQRAKTLITQYLNDPQFTGYQQLYHAAFPAEEPLQGCLVNVLFRYKEDKGRDGRLLLLVPPPDEGLVRMWMHVVRTGAERRRIYGDNFLDATRCFDYHRVCPRLGTCPRAN